jgi:hypothetical protein
MAITKRTLAIGYKARLRINPATDSAQGAQDVAFVTNFQATEDFQIQEATVLGHLGPISLDPQGYSCSITIGALIPIATPHQEGTSRVSMISFLSTKTLFEDDGGVKIPYLDFLDNGKILIAFNDVIVTSNGIQAEGNSYVRLDVQMRAIKCISKGSLTPT